MEPFRPEPFSDFSNPAVSAAFEQALAAVQAQLGKRYPMIIGGRRVDAAESIRSVNPSQPDQVVGYAAKGGLKEAEAAVEAALQAFPAWGSTPAEVRARVLFKAAGHHAAPPARAFGVGVLSGQARRRGRRRHRRGDRLPASSTPAR